MWFVMKDFDMLVSYRYDVESRLMSADTMSERTSSMTWDADSNRVSFTSSTGGTSSFVYDTTAGIPAVIEEVQPDESSVYYVREPNGSLIGRVAGENTAHYHFDALGSTRLLTNASGAVTDTYSYDAWGNLLSHTGSTAQPYQFVGQLGYYTRTQDTNMNLLQLGVRFYDSTTARFTQVDRARGYSGDRYIYARCRPVSLVDPDGLKGRPTLPLPPFWVPFCLWDALQKARDMHTRNDKVSHCYLACKIAECAWAPGLGQGLLDWFVDAGRREDDLFDSMANEEGDKCARNKMGCWPFNKYPDCYTCCLKSTSHLPNEPGPVSGQ